MRTRMIATAGVMAATFTNPAFAQQLDFDADTIEVGRFDYGKMWLFEYAPKTYFTDTYGFQADDAWFERARLSALRIPGCSASFVSEHGLVATNHHCVRDAVAAVGQPGEQLLDDGFYATTLEQERSIPNFYADQLIAAEDVSDEVFGALDDAATDTERAEARETVTNEIISRARARYASEADSLFVQVVDLYGGGRYSVYVFRRYTDVRLVFAVELEMGFFGGDPDNFTYPRYALDFAFLRIYEDDEPFESQYHFGWGAEGVEEGDAIFVIGNPGQTNRLATMEQIRFQGEVTVPAQISWYASTHRALSDYYEVDPQRAETMGVRDLMFSLSNALKASRGRMAALQNAEVVGRKAAGEKQFIDSTSVREDLATTAADLLDRVAQIQVQKRELAAAYAAFLSITNPTFSAATIQRAMFSFSYFEAEARGATNSQQRLDQLQQIQDMPPVLERGLLENRLTDFADYFETDHPAARFVARYGTPETAAEALLSQSELRSASSTASAVSAGTLTLEDPLVQLGAALLPAYNDFAQEWNTLSSQEWETTIDLGRTRFDVFGQNIPPDGTFSPRITDGIVQGYDYNGTRAPPYTTFFGVYDRAFGHRETIDWRLPERWALPPDGLDLATPINFVSTADTYGGNSGSPAVTRDLSLVGLNFDRNINGLTRDYIYLPEQGRNVMVDVRAIDAALTHAYDADRIIAALIDGTLPAR
ncbi:MAG: S46 family peptidase [Gemmatimonadetes bacterium]|nr:S46 family peptidase [Gemmatimonadota bacterium]